jgi:sugar O-acyltransferase (sialic acid O-acetyltransferase NeuD family)
VNAARGSVVSCGLEESVAVAMACSPTREEAKERAADAERDHVDVEPMEKLILVGAGGHGKDVCDAALRQGRNVIGFVDDDETLWGRSVLGRPILGGFDHLSSTGRGVAAVIALSSPETKLRVAALLEQAGVPIAPSILHPSAVISPFAWIEDGAVVLGGAVVQAEARVSRHAYVHTASSVSHDARVGEYASLHPGVQIGGGAHLGERCFVGIGATILPNVRIGDGTIVGAGAVVLHDLPAYVTAVGVPARIIKDRGLCR